MPDRDLYSAVGWQVSRSLAESDGSTLYDYYDLGVVTRDGRARRGLIAVTSNAVSIDRVGEIARSRGFGLTSVGDETGLLSRLQTYHPGGRSSGVSAVINVGVEKTSLMLVSNGRVLDASQLMRGTGWLESQVLRLISRQDCKPHSADDQGQHESTSAIHRVCGLIAREWGQALRVATHHCAELTGEPPTVNEVAIYAPQAYAGPLLHAWREQSDIRVVDLHEAISLRLANEASAPEVHGPGRDQCRIALLQANEQITQVRTSTR